MRNYLDLQQDYFSFEYIFVMNSTYFDGRLELLNFRKSIEEIYLKQNLEKARPFCKVDRNLEKYGTTRQSTFKKSHVTWNKHKKK